MKLIKAVSAFLSVAVMAVSFCACTIGDKPTEDILKGNASVKDLKLRTEYDLAEVTVSGDYAKIDLITPGMDSHDTTAVIYSLKDLKETGRVELGDGSWSTGSIKNGFFAVDELNCTVYLYDYNGKNTLKRKINTAENSFVMSYVSDDGKYLIYGTPGTCDINLCTLSTGESISIGKFKDNCRALDYREDVFYITSGNTALLTADVKTQTLQTVSEDSQIYFYTAFGGIGSADEMKIPYKSVNNAAVKELSYKMVDEAVVNIIPSGVVTLGLSSKGDVLRIYNSESGALKEIICEDSFLSCAETEDGRLFVLLKNNKEFVLKLYNLNDIEEQPLKSFAAAPVPEKAPESVVSNVDSVSNSSTVENGGSHIIENVPILAQYPEYPTGCESVTTVMALKYYAFDTSVANFIDNYLPKSSAFSFSDGIKYGPDPNEYFIGSPRTSGSYGCYSPVIKKALTDFLGDKGSVSDIGGMEISDICKKYINNDMPVIMWATILMKETYKSAKWTLPNGESFQWLSNEHCMLLIGYDNDYYYFNDPYVGKRVKYSKSLTEKNYSDIGKQALVIVKQ